MWSSAWVCRIVMTLAPVCLEVVFKCVCEGIVVVEEEHLLVLFYVVVVVIVDSVVDSVPLLPPLIENRINHCARLELRLSLLELRLRSARVG